jgi:hypothetical protein
LYICNHCNEMFLHPDYTTEREHHIDHYYEDFTLACCPYCGCTDLDEVPKDYDRDDDDEDEDDEWD